MSSQKEVTKLLMNLREGDKTALDDLLPIVYNELRRLAAHSLRRDRPNHTLQATALVNEAYLRLAGDPDIEWQNRAHFFAVAAQMMRRILIDYSLAQKTQKRGGDSIKIPLDEAIGAAEKRDMDIEALNDALNQLAAMDQRKSQIVELRFFAGLSNEEIAEVLGVSLPTVNRDWKTARAWLYNEVIKKG